MEKSQGWPATKDISDMIACGKVFFLKDPPQKKPQGWPATKDISGMIVCGTVV